MPRVSSQMTLPEPWMRRLYLPAYSLAEAARYTEVHSNTLAYWLYGPASQKRTPGRHSLTATLPGKPKRRPLSWLQLIEAAVAATFRRSGIKLPVIREAHEYFAKDLEEEFPFARREFMSDGIELVVEASDIINKADFDKIVIANRHGQLGWKLLVGERFAELRYEHGLAVAWHLGGTGSPDVVMNPRVSYGAPAVGGTPTWAVKGRYEAGEELSEIEDDFGLSHEQVVHALLFEGVPEIAA